MTSPLLVPLSPRKHLCFSSCSQECVLSITETKKFKLSCKQCATGKYVDFGKFVKYYRVQADVEKKLFPPQQILIPFSKNVFMVINKINGQHVISKMFVEYSENFWLQKQSLACSCGKMYPRISSSPHGFDYS